MNRRSLAAFFALCAACAWLACANRNSSGPDETGSEFSPAPSQPQRPAQPGAAPAANPDPWPRTFALDGAQATRLPAAGRELAGQPARSSAPPSA